MKIEKKLYFEAHLFELNELNEGKGKRLNALKAAIFYKYIAEISSCPLYIRYKGV